MALHRTLADTSYKFDRRLRNIAAVTDLPAEVNRLRAAMDGWRPGGVFDRLVDGIANGTDDDLDILWCATLAEKAAPAPMANDLIAAVKASIHGKIRTAYASASIGIYEAIAAKFNAAAQQFHAAAEIVDPALPAEEVIGLPTKMQTGWKAAAVGGAELSRIFPVLVDAAFLANICADTDDAALPLCVDPREAGRRELWAAWEIETTQAQARRAADQHHPFTNQTPVTDLRCGRWAPIIKAHAVIRACKADEYRDYPRPKPMVERVTNGPGGPVRTWVDPEAPDYREPVRPKLTAPERVN